MYIKFYISCFIIINCGGARLLVHCVAIFIVGRTQKHLKYLSYHKKCTVTKSVHTSSFKKFKIASQFHRSRFILRNQTNGREKKFRSN